jgi:hypothetical protein
MVKPGGKQSVRDVYLTASESKFELNIGSRERSSARITFDLKDAKRLNRELEEWIMIASQIENFRKPTKRTEQFSKIEA